MGSRLIGILEGSIRNFFLLSGVSGILGVSGVAGPSNNLRPIFLKTWLEITLFQILTLLNQESLVHVLSSKELLSPYFVQVDQMQTCFRFVAFVIMCVLFKKMANKNTSTSTSPMFGQLRRNSNFEFPALLTSVLKVSSNFLCNGIGS